jgi:hypothetical protein
MKTPMVANRQAERASRAAPFRMDWLGTGGSRAVAGMPADDTPQSRVGIGAGWAFFGWRFPVQSATFRARSISVAPARTD